MNLILNIHLESNAMLLLLRIQPHQNWLYLALGVLLMESIETLGNRLYFQPVEKIAQNINNTAWTEAYLSGCTVEYKKMSKFRNLIEPGFFYEFLLAFVIAKNSTSWKELKKGFTKPQYIVHPLTKKALCSLFSLVPFYQLYNILKHLWFNVIFYFLTYT